MNSWSQMAQSQTQTQPHTQSPRQYHHPPNPQHPPQYTAGRYQSSSSSRQPQSQLQSQPPQPRTTHSQSTQSPTVMNGQSRNDSTPHRAQNGDNGHLDALESGTDPTPQSQPHTEPAAEPTGGIDDAETEATAVSNGTAQNSASTANGTEKYIEKKEAKKPFSSQSGANNLHLLFGTRYEVKCDETFAYYEGYVFDYDEKEAKLLVAYPWKADQAVPVSYVRPLAPAVEASWKPRQGDHVECQAKAEESEPYGWWDCSIKTVRDNLYLITYEGWDNHHEVLQHNMLRPYNEQEPFEDDGIVRKTVDLSPERIREFRELGQSQQGQTQDLEKAKQLGQLRRIMAQT